MPDRSSSSQVARALASTPQEVVGLWRMLGLPLPPEGFDEEDVALLRTLLHLAREVGGPQPDAGAVARPVGHHASRLATWQVLGLVERLTTRLPPEQAAAAARDVAERHAPVLEALLLQVWRRHVEGVLHWRLGRASEEAYDLELSVGFSDMVDYTALTAGLEGRALAALVRTFERVCVEVVAGHGGRIVKTLGDEVLYVADAAEDAVLIGLELRERAATSGVLPDVRVGIATGAVTAVLGDVYGVTVNRAARLTKAAQPAQVLVDTSTAEQTSASPLFGLEAGEPVLLPGLGEVALWTVLAEAAPAAPVP